MFNALGDTIAVEWVAIGDLKPYAANARIHPKQQVRQIAESIRAFGFTNPVLVGANNEIIAGHGRVEAAKLLGMQTVPILRLPHLDATQRKACRLADNKIASNGGWDLQLLRVELSTLVDSAIDVGVTGFSLAEVEVLANQSPAPSRKSAQNTNRDAPAPGPPAFPVSRSGEVWLLDRHELTCGDTDRGGCDAIVRQFELLSGRMARLAATGEGFAETANARSAASTQKEQR